MKKEAMRGGKVFLVFVVLEGWWGGGSASVAYDDDSHDGPGTMNNFWTEQKKSLSLSPSFPKTCRSCVLALLPTLFSQSSPSARHIKPYPSPFPSPSTQPVPYTPAYRALPGPHSAPSYYTPPAQSSLRKSPPPPARTSSRRFTYTIFSIQCTRRACGRGNKPSSEQLKE